MALPLAARHCSTCQTELPPSSMTGGLCPACLLESAISFSPGEVGAESALAGASATPVSPEAAPLGRLGDYELLGELGRGGQGVVYRARHRALQREVALKVIRFGPAATVAHVRRFRTEAQVTARLDHPAIVPIFDVGEADGQHFIAMKLIDGASLARLSAAPGAPLPSRRAVEILALIARAIHCAHGHGVLHRDLKPGNILLDAAGRPYVTDFGLAKLAEGDSSLTQSSDLLGTPGYMAPEIVLGDAQPSSRAADVYGLGAVLYFLLTGRPPFSGGTPLEIVRHVVEREPLRPRHWNATLDRDLELICLKCLEKEPARRYDSAAALADDLECFGRGEPIRARSGATAYRARKWLRRHRSATLLAAAAIALIAAGLFVVPPGSSAGELGRARHLIEDIDAIPEDFALAEDIVEGVLARRPTEPAAVILMAQVQNVYLYRGLDRSDARLATARRFAERAVQLAPDDPDALGALGVCLIEQRIDFERAVALLDRAIALKPTDPFLHRFRVSTLFSNEKASAADVVAAAEQSATLFPNDPLCQYQLARIYREAGRFAEMETYLDRTIALAPVTSALIWKALAALWVRGDRAEMKTWLDRVPPRIRTTERVIFLQWIYAMVSGEWDDGIHALERLPQNWIEDWHYQGPTDFLTAQLLQLRGEPARARLHYESALTEVRERQARSATDVELRVLEMWILHGMGRTVEAGALYRDFVQPTLPRPLQIESLNYWWFGGLPSCLLIGDRATALEMIREATGAADSTARETRAALRLRLQFDPRLASWWNDPAVQTMVMAGDTSGTP